MVALYMEKRQNKNYCYMVAVDSAMMCMVQKDIARDREDYYMMAQVPDYTNYFVHTVRYTYCCYYYKKAHPVDYTGYYCKSAQQVNYNYKSAQRVDYTSYYCKTARQVDYKSYYRKTAQQEDYTSYYCKTVDYTSYYRKAAQPVDYMNCCLEKEIEGEEDIENKVLYMILVDSLEA